MVYDLSIETGQIVINGSWQTDEFLATNGTVVISLSNGDRHVHTTLASSASDENIIFCIDKNISFDKIYIKSNGNEYTYEF